MNPDAIAGQVAELAEPVLEDLGLELVDVEYRREGKGWTLRLFVDKPGGVTLDDCVEVSREVDTLLDVEDVIHTAFQLEVSSPGLDRPLKKARDFERFVGSRTRIKTRELCDPDQRGHRRKTFVGSLLGLFEGRIRLELEDRKGGIVELPLEEIQQARLDPKF